jgi:hypothetical protein
MIYPSLVMLRIYVFQGFLAAGQVNLKQYFVALITAWWRSCQDMLMWCGVVVACSNNEGYVVEGRVKMQG